MQKNETLTIEQERAKRAAERRAQRARDAVYLKEIRVKVPKAHYEEVKTLIFKLIDNVKKKRK